MSRRQLSTDADPSFKLLCRAIHALAIRRTRRTCLHILPLIQRPSKATPIARSTSFCVSCCIRWTRCDKRLFGSALRHNLGFLISHFWLLSEAFASLLFSYFKPPSAPAERSSVNAFNLSSPPDRWTCRGRSFRCFAQLPPSPPSCCLR